MFEHNNSNWVWLGILDTIREQHKHISFERCTKFIERASIFSQPNIRKEAYNVGAVVIGSEFVRNGLTDRAKEVRQWCERYIKTDGNWNRKGGREKP